MQWSRIPRRRAAPTHPPGAYANLEELVQIRFQARDFSLLPRQPVQSILSGRYASRLRGRGLNFEELRHYQPGDDLRTMDWKVTARTRKPHVRVYTEEKDRSVLLVVDQRISMFFGTRERFKSVTAALAAALAAWRALDVGDRVGGIVFNDDAITELRPQRSEAAVMRLLHGILRMNHGLSARAAGNPVATQLNAALERAPHMASHDGLVVVISDFLGADADTERLATRLAAHNDVLGVLVHDPVRLSPPDRALPVSDGTAQLRLDLRDPTTRRHLQDDYREEQQRIAHALRRISAPLLMLSNQGDVVQQVRALLGVRPRVSR
jgi:uncharacterized protein (DUF58 family)